MKLRTIIADDEAPARKKIRAFLEEHPDFEVIAECGDGQRTTEAIRAQHPDLVFLDVQMPGLDGFEVLASFGGEPLPEVVFVTAFDQYAVRAFEVRAVDYLLKPFNKARFSETVSRIKENRARGALPGRQADLRKMLEELQHNARERERIVVKSGSRLVFLRKDSVEWIEAQGDYVKLHYGKESLMMRETMASIAERFDPKRFVRIHRSRIINIDHVRELRPLLGGDYAILMKDGTQLTLSRSYRTTLDAILQQRG